MIRRKTYFFSIYFICVVTFSLAVRAWADDSSNNSSTDSSINQVQQYDIQNAQQNSDLDQELNQDNSEIPPASSSQTQSSPQTPSPSQTQPEASQTPTLDELESTTPQAPAPDESEPTAQEAPSAPVSTEPVSSSDEPNVTYETKMHDIYEQYYSKKMSSAQWQDTVQSRSAENYQVRQGDNLWNISKTLFGDGFYWPKIWSLNGAITDPHVISPNDTIQFTMGTESTPPAVNVTSNDQTSGDQTSEGQGAEGEASEGGPPIPPPSLSSRPVVVHLPPSLPEWQSATLGGQYDNLGMEFVPRQILQVKDEIPLMSYIAENLPSSFGKVTEIESGDQIASSYQYIYVQMKPGEGQVGDHFLAVLSRGQVKSTDSTITGFLGYAIDVLGEVQLIEKVQGNDPKDGSMFRALVLNLVNPVAVGAQLIHGQIQHVKLTEKGPHSQVVAQIIGGAYTNERLIYGNESIAYLNRGANDGLAVGQILPIRENLKVHDPKTLVTENVRPIGWLRIVKTTPHFATAIVVEAWSDVFSGDLTGFGQLQNVIQ